ncbi:MAG: restriction endonuclease subunit S [Campylobacter hyointestinalis]|nr:restriction endonuclease subunit S [Campylobacter hyointestinalis]
MKSPKIRFKEFQNEWDSRIFGDICNKFDNLRIPIAENLRKKGNIPYYGANGIQDYVDGYTHDGEFVLIAEDGANDIKNYPVQYVNGKIWVNNHAHVLQGKNGILNNIFLNYSISSINFEPILVGGSRAKLNASVMDKIQIRIPNDIKEQEAIGEFFKKIDEILDLEKLRFKKFENFKKTMLDKLFVASGENTPRLRLGSFTSNWTSVTLGEVFKERTERSKFGELLSVSISKGVTKFSELNRWDKSSEDKSNYKVVKKGDIAYNSMRMWQGASGMSEYDGIVSPAYTILEPYKNANSLFFSYMFKKDEMLYKFRIKSQGLTSDTWNLKYTNLKNIKTKIPTDLKEQEAIGEFFRKIDEILELSQNRISKLENIKKFLLNKMFV